MGGIQRRLLKAVLAVVTHPKLTLLFSGLALVGCVVYALVRLNISTDQDKLFSPDIPFHHDYLAFEEKFPEAEAMYVVIEPARPDRPPPLARWTALADAVVDRLRGMKKYVASADCRVSPADLGPQAILFEDSDALRSAFADAREQLVPLAQAWGENPGLAEGLLGRSAMQRFINGLQFKASNADAAHFAAILADSWSKTVQNPDEPVEVGRQVPDLAKLDASDPRDLGYDYVLDESDPAKSNHVLLVQVYTTDAGDSSMSVGGDQLDAIRAAARDVAKPYGDFRVGVTGRPALDAEEMRTSDRDSTRAEIAALVVIFAGMAFTLRSVWLALAAEVALAVGIGWTFGWATYAVGELNLLSLVFLITLIGIGMDYLIQILTRYRREARRYQRPAAVWTRVFRHVSPPILTACLGAAGAFFVSIFTDFRGAAELGIIAGGGLLLCLAAGYTVLPALLVLFPPTLSRVDPDARYATPGPKKSTFRRLLPPALWVVGLSLTLPFARRTHFNPNLLDMQAKSLESVKLVRKLQTWSAVVMSKDLQKLRDVRDAALASPTVASTDSVLSALDNSVWLKAHAHEMPAIDWAEATPLTPKDLTAVASSAKALASTLESAAAQSSAARSSAARSSAARGPAATRSTAADASEFTAAAQSLRRFADVLAGSRAATSASRLSQWQQIFLGEIRRLLGQFSPPPLNVSALPNPLRNHLVSRDGYYALYVLPKENLWKREPLAAFVGDVEARVGNVPGHPPLTGIAPQIFHSTASIEKSFYKATRYAVMLVLVLVFLDLRSVSQTLITVSVLALGLPMLVGLMGLFGVDWNFANFFGLPILIGAGHEYGVFMMHRYREVVHNPRRVWGKWDVSDRALLLCAFVTSSSFTFFWWLGEHEGLRSLGLVMALGTACIYLAAVFMVRPLLKWKLERAAPRARGAAELEAAGKR